MMNLNFYGKFGSDSVIKNAHKKARICLMAFLIMLPACSAYRSLSFSPYKPVPGTILIDNVPFYPQKEFQCGPASLAGVLNFWNVNKTPSEISKDIFIPSAGGTLTIDMVFYAQDQELDASQYAGTLDDLKLKIRDGYPVIVLIDYGVWDYQINHFMVVAGFNRDGIIANSGKLEKVFIKTREFMDLWKKTNYWTLWIRPK